MASRPPATKVSSSPAPCRIPCDASASAERRGAERVGDPGQGGDLLRRSARPCRAADGAARRCGSPSRSGCRACSARAGPWARTRAAWGDPPRRCPSRSSPKRIGWTTRLPTSGHRASRPAGRDRASLHTTTGFAGDRLARGTAPRSVGRLAPVGPPERAAVGQRRRRRRRRGRPGSRPSRAAGRPAARSGRTSPAGCALLAIADLHQVDLVQVLGADRLLQDLSGEHAEHARAPAPPPPSPPARASAAPRPPRPPR